MFKNPWISGDLRGSVWRQLDEELHLVTIPKIVDNLDSIIPDSDDNIAQSALQKLGKHFEQKAPQYLARNKDPLQRRK